MYYQKQDELYHFGVRGMRWGVRKDRSGSGGTKKRGKSEDYTSVQKLRKKGYKKLSNSELKKVNERLKLEKNYKQLNAGAMKKGVAFMATAAGAMGTSIALYNNSNTLVNIGKKFVNKG